MQTSLEPERDDLDEWIGKVLKAGFEDVRPPEQVWQRIAHQLVRSVSVEQAVDRVGIADSSTVRQASVSSDVWRRDANSLTGGARPEPH